jgi:tetratricopeptide (TPR) repeat protein
MVIVAARESEMRKSSPKVVDLILRARALNLKPASLKNLQQIEDLYRQALVLEPNNANAMVSLAIILTREPENFSYQMDASVAEKKLVEGRDLALKAKELDPDNPGVYSAIQMYALEHSDLEGALHVAQTRLALEPKNPSANQDLAVNYLLLGDPQRAIEFEARAINLNPKHADEYNFLTMGAAYFMLGDNDAAIEWLRKSTEQNPAFAQTWAVLAMAYALKGEDAQMRGAAAELRRLDPNETLSALRNDPEFKGAAYKAWFESKLVPAWRKAGLPE